MGKTLYPACERCSTMQTSAQWVLHQGERESDLSDPISHGTPLVRKVTPLSQFAECHF